MTAQQTPGLVRWLSGLRAVDLPVGVGTCFKSQHLGGRGRQISVSLRPAWFTRASYRTASAVTQRNSVSKTENNKETEKKSRGPKVSS